jgi:MinD-like ATPase involved in chromosome partitioning or flagellar assembly
MNADRIESLRNRILVIYSAGCGNGKSEIAANLAFSIARKGIRTWVLDANTFAPAQDSIFGVEPRRPTFSDFLLDPEMKAIPVYPLNHIYANPHPLHLFITPSERDNQKTRFALQEATNSGADLYSRIPEAVFAAMDRNRIDLLIIDTHPSFERINEVWMGMTSFLLLISRINPIDFENLKSLLKDPSVQDIAQKLIVFTNVKIDRSRNVTQDMENEEIAAQLRALHEQVQQEPCTLGCTDPPTIPAGRTDIHEKAFLYSEKLALFQQAAVRRGMFIEREPEDTFSVNIERLGEQVMRKTGIVIS